MNEFQSHSSSVHCKTGAFVAYLLAIYIGNVCMFHSIGNVFLFNIQLGNWIALGFWGAYLWLVEVSSSS